ncbi:hypothetical protein D3C85_1788220 [compost metagenome]
MILSTLLTLDVTPAQAGVHPEICPLPQGGYSDHLGWGAISGWIPAFAGMTPRV